MNAAKIDNECPHHEDIISQKKCVEKGCCWREKEITKTEKWQHRCYKKAVPKSGSAGSEIEAAVASSKELDDMFGDFFHRLGRWDERRVPYR